MGVGTRCHTPLQNPPILQEIDLDGTWLCKESGQECKCLGASNHGYNYYSHFSRMITLMSCSCWSYLEGELLTITHDRLKQ